MRYLKILVRNVIIKYIKLKNSEDIILKITKVFLVLCALMCSVLLCVACMGPATEGEGEGDGEQTPESYEIYTVTVKDDNGAYVEGMTLDLVNAKGARRASAVSDKDGKAAFKVTEAVEGFSVVIKAVPKGYYTKTTTFKASFDSDKSQEISVVKATYVINLSLSGEPQKGIKIKLYPGGNKSLEPVVGVTDELGNAVFKAEADNYLAVCELDADDHFEINETLILEKDAGKHISLKLTALKGVSEDDPVLVKDFAFSADLRAGAKRWYKTPCEEGATLVVNSPDAVVEYGGNTYTANEGDDAVRIPLEDSVAEGSALFLISNAKNLACKLEAKIEYPLGSKNNPIEITAEGASDIAISAGETLYYAYSADYPVKLTLGVVSEQGAAEYSVSKRSTGKACAPETTVMADDAVVVKLSSESDDTVAISLEAKRYKISILGDSISTYDGYSNNTDYNSTIKNNPFHYSLEKTGMSVDDTYWKKVMDKFGFELCVNNSYAASRVTDASTLNRAQNLHNNDGENPDVIIVYMGTNDLGNGGALDSFKTKYEEMLKKISEKYPDAQVYCLTLLPEKRSAGNENLANYNVAISELAEKFDYQSISFNCEWNYTSDTLEDSDGMRVHPNVEGMQKMADSVIKAIKKTLK